MSKDIGAIFEEGTAVDRALAAAYAEAALRHKRMGVPLVVWRDGAVALIPPEEIVVPSEAAQSPAQPRSAGSG